eukprot:437540_1
MASSTNLDDDHDQSLSIQSASATPSRTNIIQLHSLSPKLNNDTDDNQSSRKTSNEQTVSIEQQNDDSVEEKKWKSVSPKDHLIASIQPVHCECSLFNMWLKICSYHTLCDFTHLLTTEHGKKLLSDSNDNSYGYCHRFGCFVSICWFCFVFVLIAACIGFEYYGAISSEYHDIDHVPEIAWIITVSVTYCVLQLNLNTLFQGKSKCCINDKCSCEYVNIFETMNDRKCEFIGYIFVFLACMVTIRFSIFIPNICPSTTLWDKLGSISAFTVNMFTMHTFNFVLLHRCLVIITKFDKSKKRIKTESGNSQNANLMEETEQILPKYSRQQSKAEMSTNRMFNDILSLVGDEGDISLLKKNFAVPVSILFVYHASYPIISVFSWLGTSTNHAWAYCNPESLNQLLIITIRSFLRLIGLLYPIWRLNSKPHKLAKVVNEYASRDKEISHIVKSAKDALHPFKSEFKVLGCVKVKWVCLWGTLIGILLPLVVAIVIMIWDTYIV